MDGALKISIVEDNKLVRESLERLCKFKEFETKCFGSSEAFLSDSGFEADCYVFDFRLPGISGFELVTKIRASGDTTPVVLISGNFSRPTLDEIKHIPNVACLSKPFPAVEFLDLLERIGIHESIA
jgi:FixJ family two-component response regulator